MKKINNQQINKTRLYSIDAFRIIAAFFVVAIHFNFIGFCGKEIWVNSYFAVPWFFLVSGFFLNIEGNNTASDIKKRAIHIGKVFVITVLVYAFINILYFAVIKNGGMAYLKNTLAPKEVAKFLLLNVWPFEIGGAIWFLQAMIYSYVIILLLIKTKLIKYELLIIIVLLVINALFGELASIFGFKIIAANCFTRALPYMLLGHYIKTKKDSIKRMGIGVFLALVGFSIAATIFEYYFLKATGNFVYYGHYQGNTILAVVILIFLIQRPMFLSKTKLPEIGKKYALLVYLVHQPLGYFLSPYLEKISIIKFIVPVVIFLLSLFISMLIKCIIIRCHLKKQ